MICENCGHHIKESRAVISTTNEHSHYFCRDCANLFGTCVMCAHNTGCAFMLDPDPTPPFKVVARQIQQGNATFIEQKQIPNGDRIKNSASKENASAPLTTPNSHSAVVTAIVQLAQIIARKSSSILFKIFLCRKRFKIDFFRFLWYNIYIKMRGENLYDFQLSEAA